MAWVRIVHGNHAGKLQNLPLAEAEANVSTGFAEFVHVAEIPAAGQSEDASPAAPDNGDLPTFEIHKNGKKFDVVNGAADVMNGEPLTKEQAQALVKELEAAAIADAENGEGA